jgi:hypothetical protein
MAEKLLTCFCSSRDVPRARPHRSGAFLALRQQPGLGEKRWYPDWERPTRLYADGPLTWLR